MYLTLDTFQNNIEDVPDCMRFSKPHLVKGGCKNMKLLHLENPLQYMSDSLGELPIDAEIYERKEDMGHSKIHHKEWMPFREICDRVIRDEPPYCYLADVNLVEHKENLGFGFMSQFGLEFDRKRDSVGTLLFVGNNSRSGCHIHSGNDYVLNQIVGRKVVYMFDYYDNDVEFRGLFSSGSNFTRDNFFRMDHSKMKIYKVELEEGDSLTIPPWWFHAVQGVGLSCSVTKTYQRDDWFFLDKHYLLFMIGLDFVEEHVDILLGLLIVLVILYLHFS